MLIIVSGDYDAIYMVCKSSKLDRNVLLDDVAFSRELLQAKLLLELMSQAAHKDLVL
jgi:hypothetical protein